MSGRRKQTRRFGKGLHDVLWYSHTKEAHVPISSRYLTFAWQVTRANRHAPVQSLTVPPTGPSTRQVTHPILLAIYTTYFHLPLSSITAPPSISHIYTQRYTYKICEDQNKMQLLLLLLMALTGFAYAQGGAPIREPPIGGCPHKAPCHPECAHILGLVENCYCSLSCDQSPKSMEYQRRLVWRRQDIRKK